MTESMWLIKRDSSARTTSPLWLLIRYNFKPFKSTHSAMTTIWNLWDPGCPDYKFRIYHWMFINIFIDFHQIMDPDNDRRNVWPSDAPQIIMSHVSYGYLVTLGGRNVASHLGRRGDMWLFSSECEMHWKKWLLSLERGSLAPGVKKAGIRFKLLLCEWGEVD